MLKKILLCLTVVVSGLLSPISASAAECSMYEQSHPNFTLDGSHLSAGKCSTCASCHKAGVFLGTPKSCVTCHNGDPLRVTVGRSSAHIPTVLIECSNCHNTTAFTTTWSMDHGVVSGTSCTTCHSGTYSAVYNAQAKPSNHVPTSADCGTCHTIPGKGSSFPVSAWDTVSHSSIHAGITTGCLSCHNNIIAKGKLWYSAHPVTSDQCETCHSIDAAFKCAQAYDIMINYASMFYHNTVAALKTLLA